MPDPSSPASHSSLLSLSSISFLSPTNHPLYIRSFPQTPQADLTHWHISFAALDYVEDAIANGSGGGAGKEGYLGLLVVVEDLAVYGYKPSSNITILVTLRLQSQSVRDHDMLVIFHALHQAYLLAISNPFTPSSSSPHHSPSPTALPARDPKAFEGSKRLEKRVKDIVASLGVKV